MRDERWWTLCDGKLRRSLITRREIACYSKNSNLHTYTTYRGEARQRSRGGAIALSA